ncbi:hypothetical protein LJK87_46415 [Paenibacillus sp. P25]|nr:hypothetical protein LJK87_46415 [Paenibacillus sp. P25]
MTVLKNGNQVSEAGLKYWGTAKQSTYDQSNVFDRGRQKIVPKDQLERVKELFAGRAKTGSLKSPDYADTHRNASDRLRFEDVESKPLPKQESMDIVNDTSRYANQAFPSDLATYTKTGAVRRWWREGSGPRSDHRCGEARTVEGRREAAGERLGTGGSRFRHHRSGNRY